MKGFQPGDPRAVAAGKKAGAKSGEIRRQQRERRWKGFGIPTAIGMEIRKQGYEAGWRKGYAAGLRRVAAR